MNCARHLLWVAALAVCIFVCTFARVQAEEVSGKLVASAEPGWPQWRGPRRDGVSDETGLMQSWPDGGPELLWKVSGIGRGWASPVISAGTIYITGDENEQLHVFALDLDGRQKWRTTNAAAWTGSWPGSRSCGTVCDGLFYHINAHARIACLYCVSSNGSVSLLKPGDRGFERLGHFDLVEQKKDFWTNPVVCDGKLYLRYHDSLYCYDVRAK